MHITSALNSDLDLHSQLLGLTLMKLMTFIMLIFMVGLVVCKLPRGQVGGSYERLKFWMQKSPNFTSTHNISKYILHLTTVKCK